MDADAVTSDGFVTCCRSLHHTSGTMFCRLILDLLTRCFLTAYQIEVRQVAVLAIAVTKCDVVSVGYRSVCLLPYIAMLQHHFVLHAHLYINVAVFIHSLITYGLRVVGKLTFLESCLTAASYAVGCHKLLDALALVGWLLTFDKSCGNAPRMLRTLAPYLCQELTAFAKSESLCLVPDALLVVPCLHYQHLNGCVGIVTFQIGRLSVSPRTLHVYLSSQSENLCTASQCLFSHSQPCRKASEVCGRVESPQ